MPFAAAAPRVPSRRWPAVTVSALALLTAGWIAFAALAPAPDYADFQVQRTGARRDAAEHVPARVHRFGSGAAHDDHSADEHANAALQGARGHEVELSTGADRLAFTVQPAGDDKDENSKASSSVRFAPASNTSLNSWRIRVDEVASMLGDFLLNLIGLDDGWDLLPEGEFDYDAMQTGIDGGALSSWSESSVYVERTNSLHPSRPSSFGPHILDEPLRGFLYPIESATATDAYACTALAVAPAPVVPSTPWIAMIQRGKCPFSQKVRFAQEHGAEAVVFGDQSEAEGGISGGHGLLTPWSPENTDDIRIPSTFVSRASYLSLLRTWKDEQELARQTPEPPLRDGSTQTSISPRGGPNGADDLVGLEVVLSKDEMLASPFLDLLFVLLFLPSLLTLVTVFIQRIRLARAAQAERAPKDAVARLPVFRWGDHSGTSATPPAAAGPPVPEKPSGRVLPRDEEREVGVQAEEPRASTSADVGGGDEAIADEATTLLPHDENSHSAPSGALGASPPSMAQRAFARLPFVVQRFLPSFIRPPVPATPSSGRSRLNNARPTRRFPSIVECPFCLCDFEDGDTVMELPCGHLFHDEEVRGWLEGQKGVCPVCRTSVLDAAAAAAAAAASPTAATGPSTSGAAPSSPSSAGPIPSGSTTRTGAAPSIPPGQAAAAVAPRASTGSLRNDEATVSSPAAGGRPRSL